MVVSAGADKVAAIQNIGRGPDGRWQVVVVTKATFAWERATVTRVDPIDILESDEHAGDPGLSGPLRAAENGPPKPRVDVLLAGHFTFPSPVEQIEVVLQIGTRLTKKATVFGDRLWQAGAVSELVPSRPRPTTRVPIAWERSFGGTDPDDPSLSEPRNPVGTGMARKASALNGHRVPNVEDSDELISSWKSRPSPRGFGPLAAHWQPRVRLAGTYDDLWRRGRFPLLPADFDQAFLNVAPADQQLVRYVSGEEVRMHNMTTAGFDRFTLPDFAVPVTIVTAEDLIEDTTVVDTIVIEPEHRRFSLVARAAANLTEGPLSLRRIVVGEHHWSRESAALGGPAA